MAKTKVEPRDELIEYIESISKISISNLLSQDDILDHIILLDEDDRITYELKYDKNNKRFVFLNMIKGEVLNPKEMIEIIKNFNPGEEGIIKVVYATTKLFK